MTHTIIVVGNKQTKQSISKQQLIKSINAEGINDIKLNGTA